MKNVKSIGKRFLALLLAAVIVVGLLPVGVVAEDTVTTTPANAASSATSVTEFKAEMVRTETTAAVTDEVTGAVVIPAVYTYEVKVYVGGNDVTSSSTIWWAKGYQEKEFVADTNSWINTAIVENTNEPILAAMVMYNEETMKLLLCNATAADAPTEKDTEVWGAVGTSAWSGQMYVGIPVSCPDFYTVKAASYGFTDTVGMTYAEEYVDYNTSAGLIAKKVTAEQSPVVYSRVFRGKDGVTVYEALDYSAKITWPELNAQFKIDETT